MNKEKSWDYMSESKIACLKNIINSKNFFYKKNVLPYGAHWIYFNKNYTNEELGDDGHRKRGSFFPILKGYRRMFAGSKLYFKKEIFLNDKIKKTVKIESFIKKKSKEYNLYFFEVINSFFRNKVEVIKELQTIVFLKNKKSPEMIKKNNIKFKNLLLLHKKKVEYSSIDLFRYSALSYNSHKIHYDVDYATKKEGHRNLLVQGPLIATSVMNEIMLIIKKKIIEFNFSLKSPIYVHEKIFINIYLFQDNKSKVLVNIIKKDSELAFYAIAKLQS